MNSLTKKYTALQIAILALPVLISVIGYFITASSQNNIMWGLEDTSFIRNLFVGVGCAVVIAFLPKEKLMKAAPIAMLIAFACMILLLPFGEGDFGFSFTKKWLTIGELCFCPGKAVIPAYILFIAYLVKHDIPYTSKSFTFHQKLWIVSVVTMIFITVFSDGYRILSLLVFSMAFGISMLYGNKLKHMVFLIAAGVLTIVFLRGIVLLQLFCPEYNIPLVNVDRVMAYVCPSDYRYTNAFHSATAFQGILDSRLFGKGFSNGTISTRFGYLPDDWMFSALIEDYGWVAACILIGVVIALVYALYQAYRLIRKEDNQADQVIIIFVLLHIAVASLHNVVINFNVIPASTTEIPFLYCGQNAIFTYIEIGLVLNTLRNTVGRNVKDNQKNEQSHSDKSPEWLPYVSTRTRASKTFETYQYVEENQEVFEVCRQLSSETRLHNPLYLYSKVGMGKTHLCEAMGNDFLNKDKKIVFINCCDLHEAYIEYIRKENSSARVESFVDKLFGEVDLVIVEEVERLKYHQMMRLVFEEIITLLYKKGKAIVMTSLLSAEEANYSFDKIATCTYLEIPSLSKELKIKVLKYLARRMNLNHLSNEQFENMAESAANGFELEGRIMAAHLENLMNHEEDMKGEDVFEN